jgi:hypothetical protein
VIAKLATHDASVQILGRAGKEDELRVVVRKLDGTLVADGVTLDALRATDPTLHALVTSAVASRSGDFVDARIDVDRIKGSADRFERR